MTEKDKSKSYSEKNDDGYKHILKYTGVLGGVQGLIILIGLVRNKAMALLLGTAGVGFNALLTSMQTFAAQCTNLGISFVAVPRLSELHDQQKEKELQYFISVIRWWSLIASILGFVFCIVVSPMMNKLTFSWGNHTLHYAMIGVAVACAAIAGGEMAILKATRRLGALARTQIYSTILAVATSIPLYYFFHHTGIVPAIVLTAGINMLVTIGYSWHFYPPSLTFERRMLAEGAGMVKLGLAFVVAAAVGSGAEMVVRSFLNVEGSMDDVGLYNAAFMITITYAGLVFTSMESDYYPRLSSVAKDVSLTNQTVNRQMEVSLLLLSPMLMALITALPIIVPLLFSKDFLSVVGMAQIAVLAMYFKVQTMPVAYITLARSRSLSYLFLETSYYVALIAAIVICYRKWGIWGTGLAIVVAHVIEYLLVTGYAYWQYEYRATWAIRRYAVVQILLGIIAYAVTLLTDGWLYWTTEAALTLCSTAYSVHILRQKTHLWQSLMNRLPFVKSIS